MSDEQEGRYKIVFLGPVHNDLANVNKLAAGLKDRFKLSDEAVTDLMRKAPIAIKKEATFSEAQKYKKFLEAMGGKVQIEPMGEAQEGPQHTAESPPPLAEEPPLDPGTAETVPSSLEATPPPQREEPRAGEEESSPREQKSQHISAETKKPPPPPESPESSKTEKEVQAESPLPLAEESPVDPGTAETVPSSLEAAPPPQREEPRAGEEESSSLDREPRIIPVRAKKPPPPTESAKSSGTKPGAPMVKCPQCGYVQEQTDECIKCGVIISKFVKYLEEVKPVEGEGASSGVVAPPAPEGSYAQRNVGTPLGEPTSSTPWEDMANLGFFSAFFQTVKEVFSTPDIFFRRIPVNNGILNPLIFGIIAGYIGAFINSFWQYAFSGMFGGGLNFAAVSPVIFYAFILPLLIIIFLFVGSIIIHISVMMLGGKRGFEATFRVLSFSNSIQLVSIVPLFGALYALIYYPVLIIIGLKETHRITTGRAAFVVFISIVIGLLVIGGIVFLLFMTIFATFMGSMMPSQQSPPSF